MDWWKKFPWRRMLALLVIAGVALAFAMKPAHGEEMFVKVDSSSPDAVLQSSADFFEQEPIGRLLSNQPVEMLDETDGEYVKIRATVDGRDVEGWIKKIVLQDKPLENQRRVSESGAVESASFASNGYNEAVESEMKEDSPEMAAAIKRVDAFEAGRNRVFGGNAENPDPVKQQQHIKKFARDGKLIQ